MPNRIIKESICTSDSVDQLTWFEECLFYRLIVSCDDFGRYDGRPAIIKNRLFPLKEFLTVHEVADALSNLENAHLIEMYEHDGRPYLYLPTWENHQSIRAKKSKYPSPDEITCVIADENICKQMYADENKRKQLSAIAPVIQSNPIQSESNTNTEGVQRKRFTPPSLEEVKAYCQERKNGVDPQAFIDFYTSKGWKIGKETMKDWQAAVRTWERRETKQVAKNPNGKGDFKPNRTIDSSKLEQLRREFGV